MSENTTSAKTFPANWLIAQDYNPNDHLMNLKGKEYLDVQNRLLWFIRDQRALIASGLATVPYIVRTECVEMDRERGWAHFKTRVRDVLGNEATMYGSEAMKDFPDYAEKASTKALGRALLALGYGAGMAPELEEGDRIVDSPVSRPNMVRQRPEGGRREPYSAPATPVGRAASGAEPTATDQQLASIRKLCATLGKPEPAAALTYAQAKDIIVQLSGEYQRARKAS
ncbi:MAG TPA: hypothetical protein VIC85_00890 [Ktedonobacterales bacterium]|jgi:hypothetical protein